MNHKVHRTPHRVTLAKKTSMGRCHAYQSSESSCQCEPSTRCGAGTRRGKLYTKNRLFSATRSQCHPGRLVENLLLVVDGGEWREARCLSATSRLPQHRQRAVTIHSCATEDLQVFHALFSLHHEAQLSCQTRVTGTAPVAIDSCCRRPSTTTSISRN